MEQGPGAGPAHPRQMRLAPPPDSWLAGITRSIRAAEYAFTRGEDGAWSAPNRAHGLRITVTPDGRLVLGPRRGAGADEVEYPGEPLPAPLPAWRLALEVVAAGDGPGSARRAPRPEVDGGQIDLPGEEVSARVVNSPEGILLHLKRGGVRSGAGAEAGAGPVERARLVVAGDLHPWNEPGGRALTLRDAAGRSRLRWRLRGGGGEGGLDGDDGVRLEARPGGIAVVLAQPAGAGPMAVEILAQSPDWTFQGDQVAVLAGFSVATAGDVNGDGYSDILVGAPRYNATRIGEGRAFLFLGSPAGPSLTPDWWASGAQSGANLGVSVATAGDVNADGFDDVIVGAWGYNGVLTDEGAAFVWYGGPGGMGPEGKPSNAGWKVLSEQFLALMGYSVSTAGDVNGDGYDDIIVGADQFDSGEQDEGVAFVWHGGPSGLGFDGVPASANWSAQSDLPGALLGISVSAAGDVNGDGFGDVIVGASNASLGQTEEGLALVWLGGPGGLGAPGTPASAHWSARSDQARAFLGYSVACAGDVNGDGYGDVIVGADSYDGVEMDEGRAFVWHGGPAGLGPAGTPLNASWTASGDQADGLLGSWVATAGDVNGDGYGDVLIGAFRYDAPLPNEGAVFLWRGGPGGLPPGAGPASADWSALGGQEEAGYGVSVAAAGDVNGDGFGDLLSGALYWGTDVFQEGQARLHLGSADVPSAQAAWSAPAAAPAQGQGAAVAPAGDVNGDGFGDILVGSPFFATAAGEVGRADLYAGSASGPSLAPVWTVVGDRHRGRLGGAVAGAGDVNGDGHDDLLVGAPGTGGPLSAAGRAYLYLGSPSGPAPQPDWIAAAAGYQAMFGAAVSGIGDVNGDGFGDVAVGAPLASRGESGEGRIFVWHGGPGGLPPGNAAGAAWMAEGDQAGARLGAALSGAGDVDGDGFSDLLAGAPGLDPGAMPGAGALFLWPGSGAGLVAPGGVAGAPWWAPGEEAGGGLGMAIAAAGDVNGDGYADVAAGAPLASAGGAAGRGAVFVWHGGPGGLPALATPSTADTILTGSLAGEGLGGAVAGAGDVNGDGMGDLLVGAAGAGGAGQGQAALHLGSGTGLLPAPAWTASGSQAGAALGGSVAGAGDVNGDGFGDLLVGAPGAGEQGGGEAVVHPGNGGWGTDRAVLQGHAGSATPIALLGKADAGDTFRLQRLGRTPAGRGRVRLEAQVAPQGEPLAGSAIRRGPWLDTSVPTAEGSATLLDDVMGGLTPAMPHRWRVRTAASSPFFPRSPWASLWRAAPTQTVVRTAGCRDQDGDGFGLAPDPSCAGGSAADCDDAAAAVHPGAAEICDMLDNDCDGLVDAPPGTPLVAVQVPPAASVRLSWSPLPGAAAYDVISGDAALLRPAWGPGATAACLADDLAGTELELPDPPPAGGIRWYLVRGVACGAGGSYESGGAGQAAPRQGSLSGAPQACP